MEMRCRWLVLLIAPIPLMLAVLSCASDGWAQTSPSSDSAAASAPTQSAGGSPEQQAVLDHEQVVRGQLSGTADGDARFTLLDGLASEYFRTGMVVDSMRVREQIVDDSHIPAGRRSLTASGLAA